MKQTNKKGFAPIMTLVIILAVGLVAALGYIFYQNTNNTSSSNNTSNNTQTNNTNTTNNSTSTISKPSLEIKEWGIKIEFEDAAKVTYKTSNSQFGVGEPETSKKFIDSVKLYLLSSVTEDLGCQDLGIGLNRYSPLTQELRNSSIDGYLYELGGGPGPCGPGSSAVETLRTKIITEELGNTNPNQYKIVSTKQ
jgi:hypothetical protein